MKLKKGATMQLRGADGIEIRCGDGQLWLTEAGDPVDYFLEGGASHRVRTHGVVVIEALNDTTLEIERSPSSCAFTTPPAPLAVQEAT
ncbi:MAG: DUF2917 domain-containing protein [Burkholderiales bacterium]|nr:DUF2917 domain-containing protein [Burkholderiales bacterium]